MSLADPRATATVREIAKRLDHVASSRHKRHDVFSDWLELTAATLGTLGRHTQSVLEGKGFAEDTPETLVAFERAAARYENEWPAVHRVFGECLGMLMVAAWPDDDTCTYADVVGEIFEGWELGSKKGGQFFTPEAVSDLMATTCGVELEVYERIRPRVESTYEYRLIELTGTTPSDKVVGLLYAKPDFAAAAEPVEPVKIHDPCCGSGRTLLAVAKSLSRWMIDYGLVTFAGQDIDRMAYLMAKINGVLYLQPRVMIGVVPVIEESEGPIDGPHQLVLEL